MTTPFNIIEESCQQGSFSKKDARKAVDLVVRPGGWGENGPGVVIIRGTGSLLKKSGWWVLIFFVGINARENQFIFGRENQKREEGGDHQGNRILTEKNQGGWVLIFLLV